MTIQVKHSKVSTIPDTTDTSLVRPSDWNADHTLVGTIDVPNGGTGASTLTGYVKGNGTSAMTASATIPSGDVTGLGTMSTQNANAVAITGGTINGTTIGATTPAAGKFTTLESTGTGSFGTTSAQYIQAVGNATEPQILAVGSGTNIPLVLQPKGTGAIQAQATTSTTAGGNVRGANAVDWQTSRASASNVASGQYAVVAGGLSNTATGFASSTAGGAGSSASNTYAFVGSGASSVASGYGASVVAGYTNTAAGFWNFIGNGYTNSGTSGSAVTTQSGTMNATTAVTLSGSNANIKVGQLITGTSITTFPHTYVAAISGTSLTLSQAASGSSTSTLSFFTPHGVVVGGGNNQATGSYSFIGGGGDAGTAANRNVASGDWSFVGGGIKGLASGIASVVCGGGTLGNNIISGNTASGTASFVGGGYQNTASSTYSAVINGQTNNATSAQATVLNGTGNTANSGFSTIINGQNGITRSIVSNTVIPSANPLNSVQGASQSALLVLARQTTDATATALTCDQSAAGTTNQVILPNNSAYFFTGEVISGVTGGGNTKGWTIEGVIKRGANAASTTLVGTPTVTSLYADAGAATWALAVTADTTNGGIRVTFTGQASTTIRTVCQIRTTEMTY